MLWFTSQKRQGLDKNKDNCSLTTTQATGCVSLVNPKSVRELGPRGYSNVWIFRLSRHFSLFYPESFTPKLANMSICHATIIRAATFFTPMWDNSVNLSKRGIARVLWDTRENSGARSRAMPRLDPGLPLMPRERKRTTVVWDFMLKSTNCSHYIAS